MRLSQLFGSTLREAPSEADTVGHGLLLRAGYVRQLAAGIFTNMPLAQRTLRKIENIIREEMDAIGGQEMTMPVVHPADIWKETQRWYQVGDELTRFQDRGERDMVLAMTHEEVVTDIIRKDINSYRQLPKLIYQIQTKWRDEPRPRAGLIRTREFVMKDSYSLDIDNEGLDVQYRAHYQAYFNMYHRCGLDVVAVASDTGMMGGQLAHEFMYLTDIGEDTLLIDEASGYYANAEVAKFSKELSEWEEPKPLELVETPDCKTIDALAKFLNIPKSKTAKAVFMMASAKRLNVEIISSIRSYVRYEHDLLIGDPSAERIYLNCGGDIGLDEPYTMMVNGRNLINGMPGSIELNSTEIDNLLTEKRKNPSEYIEKFVFAIVRGDMEVNLIKLANVTKAKELRPATEEEIRAIGAEPGYGSPIGVKDCLIVVDDAIPQSPNLVAGANKEGYHHLNTNVHRDYQPDIIADIALAQDGDTAPDGKGALKAVRGVEVGNIFKLGTRYSQSMGATYTDEDGNNIPVVMGSYGVGVGRLLACIAEEFHDENGLILPISVAPYQVHIVGLKGAEDTAEQVYGDLLRQGLEVIYDEREERPGVKFNDADLIGVPIRLTVSKRSLENGGVEYKLRRESDREIVPMDDLMDRIRDDIEMLETEIHEMVVDIEYIA